MTGTAGIVLAGGRSSRMGRSKASLEWHGSTLLRRVAGIVGREAGPVVVVRAAGQALPSVPPGVRVVEDAREGRGPLQGLLAGLEALGPGVEVAYVSSVDVPLLHPRFVRRAIAAAGPGADAAVARVAGRPHPLAAAYRTAAALPAVAALVAEDRLRAGELLDRLRVTWLDADPADGLSDLNAPADYAAARALPPPEVTVQRDGVSRSVRAATLGGALGTGATLAVAVNGEPVAWDPEHPLVAGDVVATASVSAG
jgi:molybdopterin-guanine dinucleotide biosynthesis protein A